MNYISFPNNTFYLSCKSKVRDDCEFLASNYIQKGKIGKGSTGEIYEICKDKDCNYILKVIIFDESKYELSGSEYQSFEHIKELWLNEVSCLQKINECQDKHQLQFVPQLYDYWMCKRIDKTYFYIIIEKFDGNLYDFIEKYKSVDEIKIAALAELKVLERNLYMIHESCDICLNDIKLDNILYKQLDKYSFIFVFTDTRNSSLETDQSCKEQDLKRFRRQIRTFRDHLVKLET
jgi:serine/threonine protein kinase